MIDIKDNDQIYGITNTWSTMYMQDTFAGATHSA